MKRSVIFIMLVTVLFGCTPKEPESILPHQDLDSNHTYLGATITNLEIEEGKYVIYFEHEGVRGKIGAKIPTTENIYKGLEKHRSDKGNEDMKYDIMIDGDDQLIIGIAPIFKRWDSAEEQ